MSIATGEPPAGEQERLDTCALEPIRTPGAVQPHGALIAVDALTHRVTHASENALQLLGTSAVDLLGRSLDDVTDAPLAVFHDMLDERSAAANPVALTVLDRAFDVIVHRSDTRILVEFEPAAVEPDVLSAAATYSAMHRLNRAATREELWRGTVVELRRLTGFDRVSVYHFHPDGHGEIVGEDRHPALDSFLGLHFPASDIPAQARELYLSKLSRAIVDSSREGSALLGVDNDPVDLGGAELRSVSPHHLAFMHNMGQAATLSLSLVYGGRLIGMVTCAHGTPRGIPFALRQALEVLANQVALQLGSMGEIARLRLQDERRAVRTALVGQLAEGRSIVDALLHGHLTALDLIPADGAAICLDGAISVLGDTPPVDGIVDLLERLAATTGRQGLVSEALPAEHPHLSDAVPGVAGLIVTPLGVRDDFIVWFRSETARSVGWLGDLSPDNRVSTLSPRTSFSAWNRSVSGTARTWDGLDREAAELCRDLDGALLRRAESQLAALALHDPLTGLPNRRLLMDRLEHALTKYARGEEIALLYIDLDEFKSMNDTHGHEAGDHVLVQTALRLTDATRAQDTVARLGGDEFVVLCENTTAEEADAVAARIGQSLRRPIRLPDYSVRLSGSIGIAAANLTFSAGELLSAADAAMYRAKNLGRDQISR